MKPDAAFNPSPTTYSGEGMKILVAEDDLTSRIVLVELLRELGEVFEAADGEEAIQLFDQSRQSGEPFDICFLDVMMPKFSGHQVLSHIRAEEVKGQGKHRAKIIMVTALSDHENIEMAVEAEGDGYIVKPVDRRKLLGHIPSLGVSDIR